MPPNTPKEKYKKQISDQSLLIGSNLVKPQNIAVEEAVLGAILLEKDAISIAGRHFRPEIFYKTEHQHIAEACLALYRERTPIDILTASHQLKKMGKLDHIGGSMFLVKLASKVSTADNIEFHFRILAEHYMKRELIAMAVKIAEDSFDAGTDVFDIRDNVEGLLDYFNSSVLAPDPKNFGTSLDETVDQMEADSQKEESTGLMFGLAELDRIAGGLRDGNLFVLGAKPAMGKTAFMITSLRNQAMFGCGVGVFSLEMSSSELNRRLIAQEAKVPLDKLKQPNTILPHEWTRIMTAIGQLKKLDIRIDDNGGQTLSSISSTARKWHKERPLKALYIDYLALITSSNKMLNGEALIAHITRGLKKLAKELSIPIIVLAQLSRELDKRNDKRPQLSDLKGSGAIEADADTVAFLYRGDYYKAKDEPKDNEIEVIIAKQRDGGLGTATLKFLGHFSQVKNNDGFADSDNVSPSPVSQTGISIFPRIGTEF
jgi:replicative DNA helicase